MSSRGKSRSVSDLRKTMKDSACYSNVISSDTCEKLVLIGADLVHIYKQSAYLVGRDEKVSHNLRSGPPSWIRSVGPERAESAEGMASATSTISEQHADNLAD